MKKKSKKSLKTPDNDEEEEKTSETPGNEPSKFSGLLKMPFKKSKKAKGENEKDKDDEDSVDLELVLDSSSEETEKSEKLNMTEEASITSMTEEWAKFHENNESMEVETSVKEEIKKFSKKSKASVSKKIKPEDGGKVVTKDQNEKPKEVKSKVENSKKSTGKLNTLAKFFGKAKEIDSKIEDEVAADKVDEKSDEKKSESVTTTNPPQATSTPLTLRTSPRKCVAVASSPPGPVDDATVTPLRTSPRKKLVNASPASTPDPDRAHKLNIAKLVVRQTELNIDMERAVEDKDFLKAHETKEAIKKVEAEIAAMEADTSYVSQSLETSKIEENSRTPKTSKNKNVSIVSTPGSAKSSITPGSKMTKKEKLEQERQEKREALEKEKQAKKEALEKEKLAKQLAKEKEKAEKERLKELERKAKEEEKLEKERIKKAEKEKADEEKLRLKQEKEEERMKQKQEREEERLRKKAEKEEEAKQKEEEKRLQEEAEKEKAKKTAQAFTSFFKKAEPKVVKESVKEVTAVEESASGFTPFRVKENMKMAPLVRGDPQRAKKSIDSLDMPSGPEGMYLALLKKDYAVGKQGKTWPYAKSNDRENDVEIIDDEDPDESDPEDILDESDVNIIMRKGGDKNVKLPRAKLLKFHENRRPAYWGTWTKDSKKISGRRPFAMDEERFEYDYDSDDDWEEEEEGESLSDDEKDKEEEDETEKDDYEVDNEFFVPHGYLSDEEEDKEEDEVLDPETAKQKQKLAAKEFEKEHKKKTQELKPRLWGTYWPGEAELDTGAAALQLAKILGGFSGIVFGFDNNNPISTSFNITGTKFDVCEHITSIITLPLYSVSSPIVHSEEVTDSVKATKSAKMRNIPEESVEDLVKLVHRNLNNKVFLAREFIAFWNKKTGFEEETEGELATPSTKGGSLSKKKVIDKIQEIAEYKKPSEGSSRCWCVKQEVLAKFDISPISGAADWTYILEQPNKLSAGIDDAALAGSRPESPAGKVGASPAPTNLITKFARVLTDDEKEEQRVRREKEAATAKQKREAAKVAAALKAAEASQTVAEVADVGTLKTEAAQTNSSPLARFTQQLTEMQKAGQLSRVGDYEKRVTLTSVKTSMSPVVSIKKVPLTTISGVKNNPITAIANGPPNVTVSPIAIKRKPGPSASSKASPIAIKRKPGPAPKASSSSSPCFKGLVPNGVTVTHVPGVSKTMEKKFPVVECVTIEDSN